MAESSAKAVTVNKVEYQSVTVLPQATVTMALHGFRHKYESVHGILLGKIQAERDQKIVSLVVTEAIPVSHGAPTLPLVEAGLGLVHHQSCSVGGSGSGSSNKTAVNSSCIVGWYTAPMLLDDSRPGPVALRMVANLAASPSAVEPILLVVQNSALAAAVAAVKTETDDRTSTSTPPEPIIHALKRDFGNQWLDPISTVILDQPKDTVASAEMIQQAVKQGIIVADLIDHFEDNNTSDKTASSWYPNKEILALVSGI